MGADWKLTAARSPSRPSLSSCINATLEPIRWQGITILRGQTGSRYQSI